MDKYWLNKHELGNNKNSKIVLNNTMKRWKISFLAIQNGIDYFLFSEYFYSDIVIFIF